MNLILLGSPGVGKGTYTQDLVKTLHLVHVSSGDLFREHIKNSTPLGKQAQEYIQRGSLVPDELTIAIVKERLQQPDCQQKGFILDGFPRTVPQAEALEKVTAIDLVINFKADQQVIINRLAGRIICRSCGRIYHQKHIVPKQQGKCDVCQGEIYQRDDDRPEAVKNRLEQYAQQAAPLIAYYKKKGRLREITINEEYGTHKEMIQQRITSLIEEALGKTFK